MEKKKIAIRLTNEAIKQIDNLTSILGLPSRNQFILEAIGYYMEQYYISNLSILPISIEVVISSNLSKLEQNVSSFLFKNAVETAMLTQVLAMIAEIDPEDLSLLRKQTTELVKQSVGRLDLEALMKQKKKEGD